jgi:orotidine-5'-phosphate decarboxylase
MNFNQKLLQRSRSVNSLLCIGLDTDINKIPDFLQKKDHPVFDFNSGIIKATKNIVCAYKINLAFYESLGKYGWEVLEKTLDQIPNDIIIIADAKRGDIGNTSALYARAFFETLNFDAITVNPFLGFDSIQPFLEFDNKGVFILTLTSNTGSKDFQYLKIDEKSLYIIVAEKILEWNKKGNCGLVVGATHPEELHKIREIVPDCPILIPGIGAQGGDLESTVKYGCDKNGEMALINLSRAIIYASNKEDYAEAAFNTASENNDKINFYRKSFFNK